MNHDEKISPTEIQLTQLLKAGWESWDKVVTKMYLYAVCMYVNKRICYGLYKMKMKATFVKDAFKYVQQQGDGMFMYHNLPTALDSRKQNSK